MGLVADTAAVFALGAYVAPDVSPGWSWSFYVAAFAALIGMGPATRREDQLAIGLLFGFGFLIGAALAPTVAYYAAADPQALWEAGGAAALFVAGFGALGYATRRDLSRLARILTWALLAIVFGVIAVLVQVPNGSLMYAVVGLVIFAGLTAYDFQRLRRTKDIRTAPLLAASIFLDILNVFLLFLSLEPAARSDSAVSGSRPVRLPQRGVAPSRDGATGWLSSVPLAPADLRGHVVLYAFWTYTCINWLRALPYVRGWDAKVPRPRPDRRRRAHAGVRVRARCRQRPDGGVIPPHRVPRGARQRLRDLARVRQPLLARPPPCRRSRRRPLLAVRRGPLRRDRARDPAVALRGGRGRLGRSRVRWSPTWATTGPKASPRPAGRDPTYPVGTTCRRLSRATPGRSRASGRSAAIASPPRSAAPAAPSGSTLATCTW